MTLGCGGGGARYVPSFHATIKAGDFVVRMPFTCTDSDQCIQHLAKMLEQWHLASDEVTITITKDTP